MRNITLALPVFGFVVATRAALAAGIGLLLADKIPASRRRAAGAALVAIGAVATIPAAIWLSRGMRGSRLGPAVAIDRGLIGATRFPRKGDDIL